MLLPSNCFLWRRFYDEFPSRLTGFLQRMSSVDLDSLITQPDHTVDIEKMKQEVDKCEQFLQEAGRAGFTGAALSVSAGAPSASGGKRAFGGFSASSRRANGANSSSGSAAQSKSRSNGSASTVDSLV